MFFYVILKGLHHKISKKPKPLYADFFDSVKSIYAVKQYSTVQYSTVQLSREFR
jgi:hypothetical protein